VKVATPTDPTNGTELAPSSVAARDSSSTGARAPRVVDPPR